MRGTAQRLGVKVPAVGVCDASELEERLHLDEDGRAQALVVAIDPLTVRHRGRIAEPAARDRLPAMCGFREFADTGGLIAYGANLPDRCRRASVYVDRIL